MSARDFKYNFLIDVQGSELVQAAQQKLDSFMTSMQNAGNQLKTYGDSATASFQKVAQSTGTLTQANQALDTSFNTQKTAITGVIDSQSRLGQATQQTTQSLIGGKSTIDQSAQSYGILSQAQQNSVQQFGKLQTETVNTTSKFEGMKTTIAGLAGGIAAFGASIFGIIESYRSLEKAQTSVEAISNKFSKAQEAVEKNQRKVNDLVKEGKTGTQAYSDALRDLEQAKTNLSVVSDKQAFAQERLNETTASFYLNIVPQVISAGGSMAGIVSAAAPLWDKLKGSIKDTGEAAGDTAEATADLGTTLSNTAQVTGTGVSLWDRFKGALLGTKAASSEAAAAAAAASPAFAGMAGAGTGATTAMSGLAAAAAPIALIIAAIVAALAAVHFNFLGFRDALNEAGKALGDFDPNIRGVLDLLKGFTGQLGISGEATDEWKAALSRGWEEMNTSISNLSNTFETTLNKIGYVFQNLQAGWDSYVASIKSQTANVVGAFTSISTEAGKLVAYLSDPTTWTKGWEGLKSGAEAAGKEALKAIQTVIDGAGKWIFGVDAWGNLTAGALEAAQNSVNIIKSVLQGVENWIDEYVTKPIAAAVEQAAKVSIPKGGPAAEVNQEVAESKAPPPGFSQKEIDAYFAANPQHTANASEREYAYGGSTNYARKIAGQWQTDVMPPAIRSEYGDMLTIAGAHPPVTANVQPKPKSIPQTGPDMTGMAPKVLNPAVFGAPAGSMNDWTGLQNAFKGLTEKGAGFVDVGTKVMGTIKGIAGVSNAAAPAVSSVSGAEAEAAQAAADAEQHQKALAGELGQTARNAAYAEEGVKKQNEVLSVMEASVAGVTAENKTLNEQIKQGDILMQSANLGYQNAYKNFQNMQVATAGLSGEVKFLSENLTTTAGVTARTAQGFQQGQKAIYDWAGGIDTAKGAAEGTMTALENVYQQAGIKLPAGFEKSAASMKAWYAVMQQAPAEIDKINTALESGFQKMISGLSDALDEGSKGFKDKIKEIEDELGFDIPKEVKTEWKLEAKTDDLMKDIEQVATFLKDPNLSAESAKYFVDNLYQKISEAVSENPKLAAAANTINQMLTEYLNTTDPDAKNAVLARLITMIQNVSATAGDAVPYIRDLNKEFGDVRNMENFAAALEGINEKLDALSKKDLSNLKDLNNIGEADAELQKAIDTQRQGMKEFTSLIGTSIGAIGQTKPGAIIGQPRSNESPFSGKGAKGGEAATAEGVVPVQLDVAAFTDQTTQITKAFTDMMTTLFADAAGIPEGVMAGIAPLPEMAGAVFLAIRDGFTGMVTLVISDAQGITPGVTAAFDATREPVQSTLMAIRDAAAGTWTTIISDAQGLGPGISAGFSAARDQSQPHISGLSEDFASLAVVPIETMSDGIAETIGSAFEEGRDRATQALGDIEQAAMNAAAAVDDIANSISSLPDHKVVEIEIQVTGDSIPSQVGAATGFSGIVANPVHFTAGEGTEPELVNIIPLSRLKSSAHIGPSSVMAATGWSGVVGAQNTLNLDDDTAGTGLDTRVFDMNIATIGGNIVGTALPVVVTGGIGIGGSGSGGYTGGGGYSGGGGGSSGGGGGNTNVDYQIDVMEGGQHLYYYSRNGVVDTNMNAEQIARHVSPTAPTTGTGGGGGGIPGTGTTGGFDFQDQQAGPGEYRTSTGYVVPEYIQTAGHNTSATSPRWQNPNMDPTTWKVTEMTSAGFEGKWKVVDSAGVNIAANFNDRAAAEEFIADHKTAWYPQGALPPPGTIPNTTSPWPTNGYPPITTTTTGGGVYQSQTSTGANPNYQTQTNNIGNVSGSNSAFNQWPFTNGFPFTTNQPPALNIPGNPIVTGGSTGTQTSTQNGQTNTQTGGGNQINIQNPNGKFYNYQSSTGIVSTNMTEAEIQAIEAQYPWLAPLPRSSGQPGGTGGLPGFPSHYNPRGWTGPRGTFTPTPDTRDNSIPIWDTGPVKYSTDYATYHPNPSLGTPSGGGGGGGGGGWGGIGFPFGDIGKWIENLSNNIMSAVQAALSHVGIQINLNGTKILDSTNNTIMRRLNSII